MGYHGNTDDNLIDTDNKAFIIIITYMYTII